MSDRHGNTTVRAAHTPGAWFVYRSDIHQDYCIEPIGVFGADDELEALRAANFMDRYCIWWPYGWTFEQADKAHWDNQ